MLNKIAIIGECMLELSRRPAADSDQNLNMALSYGGDTLNTAVYLSRLGITADYITALGDDNMSSWMIDQWLKEGVGCGLVERYENSSPGLYMIELDEHGERSFLYWRDQAPVRRLFDSDAKTEKLYASISGYEWLYFSGITLALYDDESRQRMLSLIKRYRENGGKVIFDGNYRPRLWRSVEQSKQAYQAVYELTDIALPTIDDEQLMFGESDEKGVIGRLQGWGVGEIVLKMGEKGCLVATASGSELVESRRVQVVDTTSAGDSFNAGYLSVKIKGGSPKEAASAGHKLASVVIQHQGAIIPLELMPAA